MGKSCNLFKSLIKGSHLAQGDCSYLLNREDGHLPNQGLEDPTFIIQHMIIELKLGF